MEIIYRISPFEPDNPSIVYQNDKWGLVQFCHEQFLKAGAEDYPKTYILDSCEQWTTHFRLKGKVINISSGNKNESLLKAYEIAKDMKGKILFAEDDYLWRPETLKKLERALDILPVVSPYDHPAHYTEDRFDKKYEMKLIDDTVYRTCPSNTHTFATNSDVLTKYWNILNKWGVQDHEMFSELNEFAQLWCPTHSFATHLATGCIAPNVDWNELLKTS